MTKIAQLRRMHLSRGLLKSRNLIVHQKKLLVYSIVIMLVFQFDEGQRRLAHNGRDQDFGNADEVEAEVARLNEHLHAAPGASMLITPLILYCNCN